MEQLNQQKAENKKETNSIRIVGAVAQYYKEGG